MKIYLVGGAVRNFLLKKPIKERDWVVISTNINKMLKKGYLQVGKNFPVFLHPKTHEEYALARLEKKISLGYKGFIFKIKSNIKLKEDLKRRDLTINAIAINSLNKKFYDPYHGCKDIKLKLIKHISYSFCEDPLRILRVARFAADLYSLNFNIANKTLNLMKLMNINNELNVISYERIWEEIEKALLTDNPHIFFKILYKCHALKIFLPEFNNLYFYNNLAIISLNILNIISKITYDLDTKICSLLNNINIIYFNKKKKNIYKLLKINKNLCNRLHIPNYIKKLIILNIKYQHKIKKIINLSPNIIIYLFNRLNIWHNINSLEKLLCIYEINYLIKFTDKLNLNFNKKKIIFLPKIYLNKIINYLNNNDYFFKKKVNKIEKNFLKGFVYKKIINNIRKKYIIK